MTRVTRIAGLLAVLLAAVATPALAERLTGSPLAIVRVRPDPSSGLLAQRTIDREWGMSDDSTYAEVEVPGWRSESGALALSAALPGAGQLFAGEGSGLWYLLGETAGWVGRAVTHRRATHSREEAATMIGDPYDTLSVWSFDRWEAATGGDPAGIEALWAGDRESFYHVIAKDPSYRAGFAGPGTNAYADYRSLRDRSDRALKQQRYYELGLWLNHVVSAVDALRAARFHNLPLRRDIELKVGSRSRGGAPSLSLALTRRF